MSKLFFLAEINNPGKIEASVTITMKLEDWQKLREQLLGGRSPLQLNWPAGTFASEIDNLCRTLEKRVYAEGQKPT